MVMPPTMSSSADVSSAAHAAPPCPSESREEQSEHALPGAKLSSHMSSATERPRIRHGIAAHHFGASSVPPKCGEQLGIRDG